MDSQQHAPTERELPELLAAARTSLRREVTALQRIREVEEEPAASIGESCPGVERRCGVGQTIDSDERQQVRMANGPEGFAAQRHPSLGAGADQRPALPGDDGAVAAQRDAALKYQPWEGRELDHGAGLGEIPVDAAGSLHRGEVARFPGYRERDATVAQRCRAADEETCRALYTETGVDAVIAVREREDAIELERLGRHHRWQQQRHQYETHRRTHGRTTGALAGVTWSSVRATRSVLRVRMAALALSRAARRAPLSTTFAGISRCARR